MGRGPRLSTGGNIVEKQMTLANKSPWTAPTLTYVDRLDRLVQSGTGKVTVEVGDPGEPKKVSVKG
jgi:hypothetical protein